MECEVQTAVSGRGRGRSRGICAVCGQVTGRGIQHPCSPRDVHAIREGRGRSLNRVVSGRRNRNLSVLVGREKEEAQEKIVSGVLKKIVERMGNNFCLKLLEGGGKEGCSNEVTVGTSQESVTVLPIKVFQEIKKSLKQSKNKMEEMCKIL